VPLVVADLFCGAGGLSEGFRAAGYEIGFALDKDKDSVETYRANHPDTHVEHRSVTKIDADEIRRLAGGQVDVVVGGPSCQGFSTSSRRSDGWVQPDDERNDLWSHMHGLVEGLGPRAFLMENVPGLVYWKDNSLGKRIIEGFQDLGYRVSSDILLAADYGVPQLRRRVFLVGVLGDLPFEFPDPTHLGGWRRDTLELWEEKRKGQGLLRHVSCWEALADLPTTLEAEDQAWRDVPLSPYARYIRRGADRLTDHEAAPVAEEYAALLGHVPPGGTWRDIPGHLLPDRFRGMRRTDSTGLLGRLAPERPAYTITTQFNNPTVGTFTHPYVDRVLTVREGARLQSFPDRYRFTGRLTSRYRQVGNAVPPLLATILADQLADHLLGFERPQRVIRPARRQPAPPPDFGTRRRLRGQAQRDTGPELALRSRLHQRGLRFRVGERPVPELRRTADLVFRRERIAVFVDGCFWHGCPEHARATKSHTKWWADKIQANRERDEDTTRRLTAAGWTVVRVWEHEPPDDAAKRVEAIVREARLDPVGPRVATDEA
jgi:DNA (cytosine-5)-methyltransferase 1